MWVNDSTSSQAVERQRRHAVEERQRVDRAATDSVVREEGAVRQAGEAPSREEVSRFRTLMQSRGGAASSSPSSGTREGADGAAATRGSATPSTPTTMADRFRSLFQRVADGPAAPPSKDPPEAEATPQGAFGEKTEEAGSRKPTRLAAAPEQPGAGKSDAETRVPTRDEATALPADLAKADDADGRSPSSGRTASTTPKRGDGSADANERAAQQVARGETPSVPVARKSQDNDKDGDAGSLSRPLSAPLPPSMGPSDAAAVPQQRMPDAPQQAAASAGLVAPALAELIQKHVKQMLVTDTRGGSGRAREVLLRMGNDVLPGTDLWLTRTDKGWSMRADVRSRDAYDTLLANKEDLIQRFADSALGELSIDPVFHG